MARRLARDALLRTAVLAVVWWAISEGDPEAFAVGVPAIALAVAASLALRPGGGQRPRLLGLVRFVPYFVGQSFMGGLDVTRRALTSPPDLDPDIVDYAVGLSGETPRVTFVNVVSLLPGTLSTRLEDDVLRVHVLDRRLPVRDQLRRLEARIADLYGERLERAP
jgi:multicomponent Na+:H+ antiporter subunit E